MVADSPEARDSAHLTSGRQGKLVGQGGGYSLGSRLLRRFLKIRNSTKYVQNGLDNISCTSSEEPAELGTPPNARCPRRHAAAVPAISHRAYAFCDSRDRDIPFHGEVPEAGTIVARSWHFANTIPSDNQLDQLFEDEQKSIPSVCSACGPEKVEADDRARQPLWARTWSASPLPSLT